jgi:DNA polymerase zeta
MYPSPVPTLPSSPTSEDEAPFSQGSPLRMAEWASQSTIDEEAPQRDLESKSLYQETPTKVKLDNGETRTLKRRRTGSSADLTGHQSSSSPFASTSLPPSTQIACAVAPLLTAVYASNSLPLTPSVNTNSFLYTCEPPSAAELLACTSVHGMPDKIYRDPHYSRETDAPERPREYAGLLYHLKGGKGLRVLQDWDGTSDISKRSQEQTNIPFGGIKHADIGGWEYASCPPSFRESRKWLHSDAARAATEQGQKAQRSQVKPFVSGHVSMC